MRRYFTACIILVSFIASFSFAQQQKSLNPNGFNQAAPALPQGDFGAPSKASKSNNFPSAPLSSLASVTGANPLPISTKWENNTNGRSLHTLVRDPDDALKLHFVAMIAKDNSPNDTDGAKYPSRRIAYTYSSDGGVTWTPQVIIEDVRLGYPDMILYKRGGVNVPIIAAHNGPNSEVDNSNWTTKLYIEQGNPGAGNFKAYSADRTSSTGAIKDIGYPSLGLSLNQDTLYLLGCILPTGTGSPGENLQFGKFALDADRAANWLGWKNRPGGTDSRGRVVSGKDMLRVAPNGKLGVLWSSDSNYVCYVESTDAGETWTAKYADLYQPPTKSILASDNKTYECFFAGCGGGIDFWYDQNGLAHFVWQAYWTARSGTYFPLNSTGIFSWKQGASTVDLLTVFNDPTVTDMTMFDSINVTINTLNVVDYFTGSDNPALPHATAIWGMTPLISTDPNNWMVVYETYQDGDVVTDVDVFEDGSVYQTRLFRNIYSVKTTDGGQNWSAPTPFRANDPNSDPSVKFDYHSPSTARFNPILSGKVKSDINFVADTSPGPIETGQAGWDDNTWYHDVAIKSGVTVKGASMNDLLMQNYPNPFISSTTIPVVMKNDEVVTLSVTDILGREVATLFHERLSVGEHLIPFSASNLGAGIYTYTLKTSTGSVSRTLSVVK